ncbi:uncharacterized protein FA14DRAFT_172739 [Meira miltonrushii]|uniref:Pentacotripeptide-repeat region of PRORP domain-containing protein n=1 Tax=Meira miltonrushii TaxID=1280837 RepID=A0A316VF86_9BASI|nr:uncharacterized protein FA14DRAFT_172739 [Meira miltonrushii]PWN36176.1 hypothetical protein FA14DRAFT_172739 [Meira miltonrushii]
MLRRSIVHSRHALRSCNTTQRVCGSGSNAFGQNKFIGSSPTSFNEQPSPTNSSPSTSPSKAQFAVYTPRSTEKKIHAPSHYRKTRISRNRKNHPLIAKLQEQIAARNLDDVTETWKKVVQQRMASDVSGDIRFTLVKFVSSIESDHSTSTVLSLFSDFRAISDWKYATLVLRSLIDRGENQKVWEYVQSSVLPDRSSIPPSVPPSAYEGLIICACFAAASLPDSPYKRIANLVGQLKPIWSKLKITARKKADRVHGTPLHSDITSDRLSAFKVQDKTKEKAASIYQHAVLGWGLNYSDEHTGANVNLLSRRITGACNSGYFSTLEQWLNILPQAHNEWLTMSFDGKKQSNWTDFTWASLLQGLIAHRKTEIAGRAWELYLKMKPKNEAVEAGVWNGLLQGYSAAGQWDQARTVRNQMIEQNAKQDQYTFTTLITMNFKARTPDEAFFTFEELKDWCREQKQTVNPAAMNAMVLGYCLNNNTEEAEELINRMIKGEDELLPPPNISTMNTMLRTHARRDNMAGIEEILRVIGQLNLEPDAYTFTTVMDAFTRMGHGKYTGEVYDLMMKEGIKGSEVTLSAVIKDALTSFDGVTPIRFEFAFSTLRRMELKGPHPTQVTYTNLISGLLNNADLFGDFVRKGGLANGYTRQEIVEAKVVEPELLEVLFKNRPEIVLSLLLMKRMQIMKLQPNRITYNTFLNGLLSQSPFDEEEQARPSEEVAAMDVWSLRKVGTLLHEMIEVQSIDLKENTVAICGEACCSSSGIAENICDL